MEINPDVKGAGIKLPVTEAPVMPKQAAIEASGPTVVPGLRHNAIMELLLNNGFKASPENIKLAMTLLEGQLALNRENLHKLNQSLKLLGMDIETGNVDEALFFLKNGMPPTSKNAELLKSFVSGDVNIEQMLETVLQSVEELPGPVAEKVLLALAGKPDAKILETGVQAKLPPEVSAPIKEQVHDTPVKTGEEQSHTQKLPPEQTPTEKPEPQLQKEPLSASPPSEDKVLPGVKKEAAAEVIDKEGVLKDIPKTELPEREVLKKIPMDFFDDEGKELMLSPEDKSKLISHVKQRLRFDPEGTSNKDLDEFLNTLRDSVDAAKKELVKAGIGEGRSQKELTNIKETLEFTNQIKENIYLQVPISINNHETNGEILIFKDRNTRKRTGDDVASALIALDTLSLGRYEVYVQKENRRVSCQFRLNNERAQRLTRAGMSKLETIFKESGYELNVTYKKAEEEFTLLSKPPAGGGGADAPKGTRMFDMRL